MGGVIALLGALIGAGASGYVQLHVEGERAIQAADQRRRDRVEEIITLIEKTPMTHIAETRQMLAEPMHMALPSTDAARVVALVALYFPDANDLARSYESACAEYSEKLSEVALQVARGSQPIEDDGVLFQKMLATGDLVTARVLADIDVPYKRRIPVVAPNHPR
jgi:hypothetical protein